jgi:hypothetical protein
MAAEASTRPHPVRLVGRNCITNDSYDLCYERKCHLGPEKLQSAYFGWVIAGSASQALVAVVKFMKTWSVNSPLPLCTALCQGDVLSAPEAIQPTILVSAVKENSGEIGSRRFSSRIGNFLSRLVDDSAFREISSGHQVTVAHTANGLLVY